jgi:hypothetical protein
MSILKKLVFAYLQCEAAYERDIQHITVENVVEIEECDNKDAITHQKVMILVLNNYVLICLVILDVVVMKLDTMFSCLTELVGS